jgi:putative acetyltransferase
VLDFLLRPARSRNDLATAERLFQELADWYRAEGLDVTFQGYAEELAGLPGRYAPPEGELVIAWTPSGDALGCIALRPFRDKTCEIKRLYVRPAGRGAGVGRALGQAIIQAARDLGYTRALLDTASFMSSAVCLYESLGFRDVEPYYDNPYAGGDQGWTIRFLAADL